MPRPALEVELHLKKRVPADVFGERHAALVANPEIPVFRALGR